MNETVPARRQAKAKPVKLEKSTSRFDGALSASISDVRARDVKAELPGQVSGAAVVFDLTITNSSSRVIDLNQLVVNVLDDEQVPGSRITTRPARAMPHAVAGGSKARGRFVYVVPRDARNPITVEVSLTAEQPVLTFRGTPR